MNTLIKLPFTISACIILTYASSASSQTLGEANTFNTFILGSFSSTGSDTQGAVAVGGNMNITSYDINALNSPGAGNTALYVGGNLTSNGGSINNGAYYIGGTNSQTNTGHVNSFLSATPTFDFASASSAVKNLSTGLAALTPNATAGFPPWGGTGLYLTGDGTSGPQVFNLTANQVNTLTYFNYGNLTNGQTLVFNIDGSSLTMNSGNWDFSNYNAIFNFYNATSITYNGAGFKGTMLAPLANVNGASGLIVGEVIAGSWTGQTQINIAKPWQDTEIKGYVTVPEPSAMFMVLSAGMLGCIRRSRSRHLALA